ncbi:MAG: CCA tRNA nucleotidyltransferase [Epsilonproteobacteria bacterium]|nr:CCA tRNA nucleotidyltransferase [Campylobacterota bacterium]OIO17986.1 MAG: polynucleotide adenylyltransferase [Helicobacteraceae bacterium CG1_02_36_14]PIP09995.1 MAG: polynucleotide adenylyltransferase [Sulfurimonas sp. CG23_combo_of_CG06-09_8_20_14_all_36_33]PIS25234.1 MAG: CCA tRNA nucleotidyltransferase [Sulfurimonas sp. CG08_land_8_20_14_0_20_36_33]PIU35368.1 MAG: CCA tRNA nucleotidyltransferase [Sulfurimonas sp. CG07_land_8_20_14_0_80_36_56]PIV05185.1 MAG: CCA tRNA nucleotidyltransfe
MLDYPNKLNIIFDKLKKHEASPIIIGGFVRDKFLNIDSKDIDIEVYGISSFDKLESLLKEFGSVNRVGKSFGVCKLKLDDLDLDFTLPRVDNKTAEGHSGFDVHIQANLDFITATRRRDFTINTIAYDVITKKILDPFHGVEDLKDGILKAVDKISFKEDPLRVYRAIQFCARFNLNMDKELFELCSEMVASDLLSQLSKERIFIEIKKLLLKSQKPSLGFKLLKELHILNYFPELNLLGRDDWEETLRIIDNLVTLKTQNEQTNTFLMLAATCYKLDTVSTMGFISKLSNEKELYTKVLPLVNNPILSLLKDSELFRLATRVNIEELLILNRALYKEKNNKLFLICDAIEGRAKELDIFNKKMQPLLKGRDILACGISPSKEFSNILEDAYEAQMDGKFSTHADALVWLKNYLAS